MYVALLKIFLNIKIERRLGIAKRPWFIFIRYLPGYFNFIHLILILFVASILACKTFSSQEYIFIPLILIFITKLLNTNKKPKHIFLDAIGTISIFVSILPVLFTDHHLGWLSFLSGLVSIKILCLDPEEPFPLSSARNLALNCYLTSIYIPNMNFGIYVMVAIVLLYVQSIIFTIVPRFNETKNMRIAFRWAFLFSLITLLLNSIMDIWR